MVELTLSSRLSLSFLCVLEISTRTWPVGKHTTVFLSFIEF